MPNVLGYYDPAFYANEALIFLKKGLGFASTVHMGFDDERRAFGRGDVINIRRPSTFTAAAAPSTAADAATESVQISLDQWYEVKFKLTDTQTKELDVAKNYEWDFFWTDSGGLVHKLLYGSVTVEPNITIL